MICRFIRSLSWLSLIAALVTTPGVFAADESLIDPRHRLNPESPVWRQLGEQLAVLRPVVADFAEWRFFPFRPEPVGLVGTVRIAGGRGLSLQYTAPEERIVIVDAEGMLVRDRHGAAVPPADARMQAANEALLHILQLDLAALAQSFELFGRGESGAWSLALVPRADAVRGAIGNIFVDGEKAAVRRIEFRRSAKQHIDITMAAPREAAFTPEELKRYFR